MAWSKLSVLDGCMGIVKGSGIASAGHSSPTVLDQAQRTAVAACLQPGSAVLVHGGPGSGKTTTLIEAIVAKVELGEPLSSMLVLTGSRSAAQALRTRLIARLGTTQLSPRVTTLHGWSHALHRRHSLDDGDLGWQVLTAPEQEFRVRELLRDHDVSAWPDDLAQASGTGRFATSVRALLAKARQLGLDPDDLIVAGEIHGHPEWCAMGRFFAEYLDALDAELSLDYAELLHRVRLLLLDDAVRTHVVADTSGLFVDEYAELDAGQLALLTDLHELGLSLAAFADPSTAVFGFRGADPRSVQRFAELFDRPHRVATVIKLPENHRSGAALAVVLNRIAVKLPATPGLDMAVASPQLLSTPDLESDGAVSALIFPTVQDERRGLSGILCSAHLDDGLRWSQMAVVFRSGGAELVSLARELESDGVPVQVVGSQLALADDPAVAALAGALQVALLRHRAEPISSSLVIGLLTSPLIGCTTHQLRDIGRELRRQARDSAPGLSSEELMIETVSTGQWLAMSAGAKGDLLAPVRALHRLITAVMVGIEKNWAVADLLWQLWTSTDWPIRARQEVLRLGTDAEVADRQIGAVVELFDLVEDLPGLNGAKGVESVLAEVGAQVITADRQRESDPDRQGVALLTAHQAKGREWPFVVVAGLTEDRWPNVRAHHDLLAVDALGRDGSVGGITRAELVARERRTFLLACSRAQERLLLTAGLGTETDAAAPSRFIAETGVTAHPAEARLERQRTLRGLTAQLRRTATDRSASPGLRTNAAGLLAQLASVHGANGTSLVPDAHPDRWWGVVQASSGQQPGEATDPVRMACTEISDVLRCPRQWFLGRRLPGQDAGPAARVGSVIHGLAEHAQTTGIDLRSLIPELQQAWPRLCSPIPWLAERELADQCRGLERLALWLELRPHQLLGVEVTFDTVIPLAGGDVRLVGKVDRLEIDEHEGLHIIDFKTGRSAPTGAALASHPQLGAYQVAALAGAFDGLAPGVRSVSSASLVFPRIEKGSIDRIQKPLSVEPHLEDDPTSGGYDSWAHQRLAKAAQIMREDTFPAVASEQACRGCAVRQGCPAIRPLEDEQ